MSRAARCRAVPSRFAAWAVLWTVALGALCAAPAHAQTPDSLRLSGPDSLVVPDPLVAPDTLVAASDDPLGLPVAPPVEGGLDEPVTYTAADSVRIVLAPRDSLAEGARPDDRVLLFGDVTARYRTATIRAAQLEYRAAPEELFARPVEADTGLVGVPSFEDGEEAFTGRQFVYNLRTQRGRVTGARTQIEDGFLLGGIIKQRDAHVIYASDAAYTTCALDHPHYALEAGRLKVVDGKRVYTGPVRLRLLGLPMPLWLPFGYFPAAQGRRSGPLPVRYGQETGFGLFLDNVGWYWAGSEYVDAQVSGKIGTEGSFQVQGQARYNRRYAYSGTLNLSYGRLRQGESTDPAFAPRVPIRLGWTHQQTFAAGPRLSSSVDLQSTSQRLVSDAVSQQIQQSTQSSVSFTQSWARVGRSIAADLRAFQDFSTGRATLTLPSLRFTQQRRFPLRRGRDDHWWERIGVSYNSTGTNTYQFTPLTDSTGVSFVEGLFSPAAFTRATGQDERFDYQVVHSVPVQASFQVPRFNLSLSPQVAFTETWVGQRTEQTYDPLAQTVQTDRVGGFTAVRRVAASVQASTEFFGTFPLRIGPLDGLRHTVRPNVTASFEPDYAAYGFVREVQVDSTGRTRRYATVPGLPLERTRQLSFGVENAFLVRVARADSTGEVQRRTVQVLSLSAQGGVNFAAEERPVRDVSLSFSSSLFGATASGTAGLSAYALDEAGSLTTTSYLNDTGRPLRLTQASGRISRLFRSSAGGSDVRPVVAAPAPGVGYDPTRPAPSSAVVGYVDTAAPWSFSLDVTVSHTPAVGPLDARTTATLSVNQFNVRLTPLWSMTGSTGLDLTTGEPTTTSVGLTRDLHCWEMQISWQPIGLVRGFGVSLYVKSGYLRDLLRLDVPRTTVRTPFL